MIEYELRFLPRYAQDELERVFPRSKTIAVTDEREIALFDANHGVIATWRSQSALDDFIATSRKSRTKNVSK